MSKMPNSSSDEEKFRVWHLKTTWATMGRMLIIHCFEKKKASLFKTVSLWQDFQFCFVFHEAKNANLNLYKRLLKNIQIISKKLRLAVIDFLWLLESWFSRELGASSRGEGLGCPAWAKSCKGPLLLYQQMFQVFIILIPNSVVLWDVGSALRAAQQHCCGCDFGRRCSGSP